MAALADHNHTHTHNYNHNHNHNRTENGALGDVDGRRGVTDEDGNATDGTDGNATAPAPVPPFFLFMATAGLHVPVKPPDNYKHRAADDFGRLTLFMDDTLGCLRSALETQNM